MKQHYLALATCVMAALGGGAAWAELKSWEERVAEAAHAVSEAQGPSARLAALTRLIAAQELGQSKLRAELAQLTATEQRLTDQLAEEEDHSARVLGALERLGDANAPLPLLHPDGAVAAARSAVVTQDMVAAMTDERAVLAERLAEVRAARDAVKAAGERLEVLRGETVAARQDLIAAAAARRPLPPPYDSETAAAQALALGIDDLTALGQRLGPEPAAGAHPEALPLPVNVKPQPSGDGWKFDADPGALVLAPSDGYALYAGPLRGHRLVLVIEISPGRTLTLAGLGRLLVSGGDRIEAGEGLGFLPEGPSADATEHRIVTGAPFTSGGLAGDTLYMETRDANRPVDPALWFAVEKDNDPQ